MTSTDRGTVTRWSLLLPDTWSRIRLDHRRPQQVSAVVAEAFATVSRDQAVSLRRGLEAELNALAEKAAAEGGRELYLLSDVRRGLPLAATALVSVLPETLPAETPPELLAQVLASGPGDEPAVVTVGEEQVPAVRRSQTERVLDGGTGLGPVAVTFTGLDVYLPFPDRSRILLLTFRTPVPDIGPSMLLLFEAIAGSLRWRQDEPDRED